MELLTFYFPIDEKDLKVFSKVVLGEKQPKTEELPKLSVIGQLVSKGFFSGVEVPYGRCGA